MAGQPNAIDVPPVEVVLSEFVANLAMLARAYLEPAAETEIEPDLAAAEITIDVAGKAFDRIDPRLGAQERSSLARLLTELRLSYVKKRGS
ncbi:MAG: DUF1844 domain-containing protein [Candidatus Eremiobacteraeota bacterium]|nr:DUF1844 domain-containing protein [Candidatus Eremiobacteraeota bacterium]